MRSRSAGGFEAASPPLSADGTGSPFLLPLERGRGQDKTERDRRGRLADDCVAKAPALVLGRLNWTTLEHRVVAMLIAQLRLGADGFKMQRVRIGDLMDVASVSSRDLYHRAAEVCRKLRYQTVQVRTSMSNEDHAYRRLDCFTACRYLRNAGEIEARFDDALAPYLLAADPPGGSTPVTYPLHPFVRLRSQYAMRIYEIIKMREGAGHLCLSVEALRETLCCKHTYPRFSDFRRHVLEQARIKIRATCDATFTYLVERDGRTPVRVRFLIRPAGTGYTRAPLVPLRPTRNGDGATTHGAPSGPVPHPYLRQIWAHYDLYASVLARLPQDVLDALRRAEVQAALDAAVAETMPPRADTSLASTARSLVRTAAKRLRLRE